MKMAESFSKRVENTVGKGEIARYEQFLLFLLCFQKLVLQTRKNQGLFGKGLNQSVYSTVYQIPDLVYEWYNSCNSRYIGTIFRTNNPHDLFTKWQNFRPVQIEKNLQTTK